MDYSRVRVLYVILCTVHVVNILNQFSVVGNYSLQHEIHVYTVFTSFYDRIDGILERDDRNGT